MEQHLQDISRNGTVQQQKWTFLQPNLLNIVEKSRSTIMRHNNVFGNNFYRGHYCIDENMGNIVKYALNERNNQKFSTIGDICTANNLTHAWRYTGHAFIRQASIGLSRTDYPKYGKSAVIGNNRL